jgi:hypothetical protein
MSGSRRVLGQLTEDEELRLVLQMSMLEDMGPSETPPPPEQPKPPSTPRAAAAPTSPPGAPVAAGRKRDRQGRPRTFQDARLVAKSIVDSDLRLSTIRALAPVLRYSLPSDCVAFLEVGHLFRGIPVLEEYGARVFKYAGDLNALEPLLCSFNQHYPLDADRRNAEVPGISIPDGAILQLVCDAILACRSNRYNHAQRTTGLPACLPFTKLAVKLGACSAAAASRGSTTVRLGMPVKDHKKPNLPIADRTSAMYLVDMNPDTRAHFRGLRSAWLRQQLPHHVPHYSPDH